VTTKSSIRKGVCFINPAFMHQKLRVLPWEISRIALERRVRGELAEGRVIDPDRMREVSTWPVALKPQSGIGLCIAGEIFFESGLTKTVC
jgi:hypothetical protein